MEERERLLERLDYAPQQRQAYSQRGDLLWFVGYALLFFAPALILFAVGLVVVGGIWVALWIAYLLFALRNFPRVVTQPK